MSYLKINNVDFSQYVSALEVSTVHNSKSRTNAAGNMNVKYINTKKVITAKIIPLDAASSKALIEELNKFQVTVEYLEPEDNTLKEIECIVPDHKIKYYSITADKTLINAYTVTFTQK
jgi:hypothetical protein